MRSFLKSDVGFTLHADHFRAERIFRKNKKGCSFRHLRVVFLAFCLYPVTYPERRGVGPSPAHSLTGPPRSIFFRRSICSSACTFCHSRQSVCIPLALLGRRLRLSCSWTVFSLRASADHCFCTSEENAGGALEPTQRSLRGRVAGHIQRSSRKVCLVFTFNLRCDCCMMRKLGTRTFKVKILCHMLTDGAHILFCLLRACQAPAPESLGERRPGSPSRVGAASPLAYADWQRVVKAQDGAQLKTADI